jgi:hypothetical protein
MSVRVQTTASLQVGFDSSLDDCAFDRTASELLDTLQDCYSETDTLAASEQNREISFGGVTTGRIVYVEAEGDIDVTFGGAAATSGQINGVGGTYATTFGGGETLGLIVNLTVLAVVFDVLDQSLAQVINRINSFAALAGIAPIAFENAGELQLTSPTTGDTSIMEVSAGGTALALLGLTASTSTGINAQPATSAIPLRRVADPQGSQVDTLKSYLLATIQTPNLFLTNALTTPVRFRLCVVGDLVV